MAKISMSSVINAPIDEAWARIREFNALPDWHPAFADSHIENDEPGDKERLLAIGDGVFQGGFDALKTAFATSAPGGRW